MYSKHLVKNLFAPDIAQKPTRDGYGAGLVAAGTSDQRVLVLCCDLTESTRSLEFKKHFPDRFVEIGVAEQNMAGVAAGLALEGFVPFCSSYAVFNPGRNWDQVRVSVCYNRANVKIVGAHAGISVGPDGATHQGLEDIAITRVLPDMTVISPADAVEARKATIAAAKFKGPVYMRFGREKTPVFTKESAPFSIGKAYVLKNGAHVTIAATGPLVYEALRAADQLRTKRINAEVINVPTIKPLDEKTILNSVKKTKCLVSVEEHQIAGGLGGALSELLAKKHPVPQQFVGMPNTFGESGTPSELLRYYGMSSMDIVSAAVRAYKRR